MEPYVYHTRYGGLYNDNWRLQSATTSQSLTQQTYFIYGLTTPSTSKSRPNGSATTREATPPTVSATFRSSWASKPDAIPRNRGSPMSGSGCRRSFPPAAIQT